MQIRPDILKQLLCSVCGGYLSCLPIRMKNNGDKLCGRCSDPEDESTFRITPYEELAKMVEFPCGNQPYGCRETLYMAQMKDHEEGCQYRQYVCPVPESGQCDWSGSKKDILDHCTQHHPDNVLQEPFTIPHRINESYHKTFALATLEMLFIVHCKVCINAKTIYHSVRLIGKSALAGNYKYKLKVLNNDDKLVRTRDVAPQGCMALQEDVCVQVNVQTMLQFLGDFKDITFQLTVGCKCVDCSKCVTEDAWPTDEGWCCKDCAPARRPCKFYTKGCTYIDIERKVDKHEKYYCQYSIYCHNCNKTVSSTLNTHYLYTHSNMTYKAGASWRKPLVNCWKFVLISSDVGILNCRYRVFDTHFLLVIDSPIRTEQLSKYTCVIKLTNSVAEYTMRQTLRLCYNAEYDWVLEFANDGLQMYVTNNETDIKIDLIKV